MLRLVHGKGKQGASVGSDVADDVRLRGVGNAVCVAVKERAEWSGARDLGEAGACVRTAAAAAFEKLQKQVLRETKRKRV